MPQTPIDPGARERLLDAADHLLATRGFRHMTVAAVAARADVGKGSVYLHFASKDDLALGCLDRMAERVRASLAAIAAGPGTAHVRVRRMLEARVLERFDYARRHAPSIDQKLAVMRQAMLERRAAHFAAEAACLAKVIAAARLHARPRAAAEALVLATNALLPYSLSVRELGQRDALRARLDPLLDLLIGALASDAPRARRTTRPTHARTAPTRRPRTSPSRRSA